MKSVLTTMTTNDWIEVLEAAGVPCGPVYDYPQMFADPAGAPSRSRAICERPGTGRGAAHPHAREDRRGARVRKSPRSSASTTPKSWPPWSERGAAARTPRKGRALNSAAGDFAARICFGRRADRALLNSG